LEDNTSILYDNRGALRENPVDIKEVGFQIPDNIVPDPSPEPEKGILDPSPEPEKTEIPDPLTKAEIHVVQPGRPEATADEDFYKQVAIYRPPIDYQQGVKTQIRYAAASSAILMLISLL